MLYNIVVAVLTLLSQGNHTHVTILNKQSRTANREWLCRLEGCAGALNLHCKYCTCYLLFKRASRRTEISYNILFELGIPRKLVALIEICLNENCNRVHISQNLFGKFPIQNGFKLGDAISPLLFNIALEYATRRIQENQETDPQAAGPPTVVCARLLIHILAATLHIWRPSSLSLTRGRTMMW
jgi:hypothetical protein